MNPKYFAKVQPFRYGFLPISSKEFWSTEKKSKRRHLSLYGKRKKMLLRLPFLALLELLRLFLLMWVSVFWDLFSHFRSTVGPQFENRQRWLLPYSRLDAPFFVFNLAWEQCIDTTEFLFLPFKRSGKVILGSLSDVSFHPLPCAMHDS